MYGWIFRHLPGPKWFKVIEALLLIGLVVFALFTWVYPWVQSQVNFDMTVGSTEQSLEQSGTE